MRSIHPHMWHLCEWMDRAHSPGEPGTTTVLETGIRGATAARLAGGACAYMPATCVRCVADFADCLPRSLEAPLRDPLLRDWGTPRGGARTPVRTHAQRFGHLHTGCKSGGGMAAGGGACYDTHAHETGYAYSCGKIGDFSVILLPACGERGVGWRSCLHLFWSQCFSARCHILTHHAVRTCERVRKYARVCFGRPTHSRARIP